MSPTHATIVGHVTWPSSFFIASFVLVGWATDDNSKKRFYIETKSKTRWCKASLSEQVELVRGHWERHSDDKETPWADNKSRTAQPVPKINCWENIEKHKQQQKFEITSIFTPAFSQIITDFSAHTCTRTPCRQICLGDVCNYLTVSVSEQLGIQGVKNRAFQVSGYFFWIFPTLITGRIHVFLYSVRYSWISLEHIPKFHFTFRSPDNGYFH